VKKLRSLIDTDILFVLPSFHTNLFYALKALNSRGYGVNLLCERRRDGGEDFVSSHTLLDQGTATLEDVSSLFGRLRPGLVVIRKSGRLSQLAHRICLLRRLRMVGYDQRPYLRPRHPGQIIHGALKGRPMRRFTPVHGLSGRPDPLAVYIPFPVEPLPSGTNRDYAPGGTVRILCVAKLTERRKNHFLLLRALEPLASKFDFRVTLVGSSNLDIGNPDPAHFEALKEYATHGALAGRVEIQKDVPFAEMPHIYRNHDICVLPSHGEPLGTAPLEAMSQGCAAVISSDSGSAYYVQSGLDAGLPCGAVFPTNEIEPLQQALSDLMYDPDRLARYGENAAELTRHEFAPDKFATRFKSLMSRGYKNLIQ